MKQIIITANTKLDTTEDITNYIKSCLADAEEGELDNYVPGEGNDTILFRHDILDVKVGFRAILVKMHGFRDFVEVCLRKDAAGMAINGEPIVLHGPDFKRIGCDDEEAPTGTVSDNA